ncbi:MAG TPA: hypothetical protein VM598_11105 [Bdellovibrionota bacterium]|nr:hypothetical protein [Bdellovibrionota bacterium]
MRTLPLSLISFLIPLVSWSQSQATYDMTPEEAIRKALAYHPTVQSLKLGVQAAEAMRGPLWMNYAPDAQVSLNRVLNYRASANAPGAADPSRIGVNGFQFGVSKSLADLLRFGWKAQDYGIKAADKGREAGENEIAKTAFEVYTAVTAYRYQREALELAFLPTIEKLKTAPGLDEDKLQLIGDLENAVRSMIIGANGAIETAEVHFRSVIGEPAPARLVEFPLIQTRIPLYPISRRASDLETRKSPIVQSALYAAAAAPQATKNATWSALRVSAAYGSSHQQVQVAPEFRLDKHTGGLNLGATAMLSWDLLGKARKAAKVGEEIAKAGVRQAEISVVARVDANFATYRQMVRQICLQVPRLQSSFEGFGRLREALDQGRFDRDVLVQTQRIPQVIQVFSEYVSNTVRGLNAVADIQAALGDMSSPESWDVAGNPPPSCDSL